MSDAVIFDAGPLGILVNPNNTSKPVAIRAWVAALLQAGRRVIIPEIADYEVAGNLSGSAATGPSPVWMPMNHCSNTFLSPQWP